MEAISDTWAIIGAIAGTWRSPCQGSVRLSLVLGSGRESGRVSKDVTPPL